MPPFIKYNDLQAFVFVLVCLFQLPAFSTMPISTRYPRFPPCQYLPATRVFHHATWKASKLESQYLSSTVEYSAVAFSEQLLTCPAVSTNSKRYSCPRFFTVLVKATRRIKIIIYSTLGYLNLVSISLLFVLAWR